MHNTYCKKTASILMMVKSIEFRLLPMKHHHFPMVFPWFSHGFPMVFPWFPSKSHRLPTPSIGTRRPRRRWPPPRAAPCGPWSPPSSPWRRRCGGIPSSPGSKTGGIDTQTYKWILYIYISVCVCKNVLYKYKYIYIYLFIYLFSYLSICMCSNK